MPHPPEPPWAVAPSSNEWSLTEIKQGVTMGAHALSRPCTYIGRAAAHIPVAHESCSRIHARLAFDVQQNLWLRDLGSTHGTFCNKRKLPLEACGSEESRSTKPGARGIRVYPGDVLQFGASTRIYCIEGPVPCPRKPTVVPLVVLQSTENGVLWRKEDASSSSEPIPERYHKEYEQMQALRYKLANIEQESERIRAKGDECLTKGQELQLIKNQQRETELREKINEKQQELDRKVQSDATTIQQQLTFSSEGVVVDEEEEVDDRTQQRQDNAHALNPEGETEESLQSKWNAVQADWMHVGRQLEVCAAKVTKLQQRVDKCDPDEVFFLNNDIEMDLEQKERLLAQKEELERRLVELEQLLLIVNPNWKAGRTKEAVINTSPPFAGTFHKNGEDATWSLTMPPPNAMHTEISMPPPQCTNTAESSMPPPQFTTTESSTTGGVSGPSNMPPPLLGTTNAEASPPSDVSFRPEKRQKVKGPAMPPPFALPHVSQPRPPNLAKAVTDTTNADVWCPPNDQDGSGRSKLNDKFGGKY